MAGPVPSLAPHLQPHADVAERVLLPGDPGRALRLAQWLLEGPKMLNHHRGLWGYTGMAADGGLLTIQSTGTGGPSAAIVVRELIGLGARRLIRVGSARAFAGGPSLGTLVVPDAVLGEDGASRALGAAGRQAPDPTLFGALLAAAGQTAVRGSLASADLIDEADARHAAAIAVDLESAAVLAVAAGHGSPAACAVIVTSDGEGALIDADALAAAEEAMGRAAAAALA